MKALTLFLYLLSTIFQWQAVVIASPASDLDIGDIPSAILNLLLSPGIQITHFDISLSVSSGCNDLTATVPLLPNFNVDAFASVEHGDVSNFPYLMA